MIDRQFTVKRIAQMAMKLEPHRIIFTPLPTDGRALPTYCYGSLRQWLMKLHIAAFEPPGALERRALASSSCNARAHFNDVFAGGLQSGKFSDIAFQQLTRACNSSNGPALTVIDVSAFHLVIAIIRAVEHVVIPAPRRTSTRPLISSIISASRTTVRVTLLQRSLSGGKALPGAVRRLHNQIPYHCAHFRKVFAEKCLISYWSCPSDAISRYQTI